jgi:hypothetical protein
VTCSGRSQDIALEPTAILQRTERPAGGWKVCKYQMAGYFSARTRVCTTYTTLDSVCVQVRLASLPVEVTSPTRSVGSG